MQHVRETSKANSKPDRYGRRTIHWTSDTMNSQVKIKLTERTSVHWSSRSNARCYINLLRLKIDAWKEDRNAIKFSVNYSHSSQSRSSNNVTTAWELLRDSNSEDWIQFHMLKKGEHSVRMNKWECESLWPNIVSNDQTVISVAKSTVKASSNFQFVEPPATVLCWYW
jgi:hypothetical protein